MPNLAIAYGYGDAFAPEATLDGIAVPYWAIRQLLDSGSLVRCPNDDCGTRWNSKKGVLERSTVSSLAGAAARSSAAFDALDQTPLV